MNLFHGTIDKSPIVNGNMLPGTWLAGHRFHAFRIAERRSKQQGGEPVVIEIEINTKNLRREVGRDTPTYRFEGGNYKAIKIHKMISEDI